MVDKLEGRIQGGKVVKDQELLKTEEDKISYDELKKLAQDSSRWCQ